MRSYNQTKKNKIIIGSLCAVMLLMVVGYAAFNSVLNIKGTSGISSNWDIEITNIRGGNPFGGDAYDISEPTYTPTTATFNTGLITPLNEKNQSGTGSDRIYEVEVSNLGTLTGSVTLANLSCGNNDAINCTVFAPQKEKKFDNDWNKVSSLNWSLNEGTNYFNFTLAPGEKHYIYIEVYYKHVANQPNKVDANVTLELTYEQTGVNGENATTFPTSYNGTVYSFVDEAGIYIGDSLETIPGATTDYKTLGKSMFLKHEIVDGKVSSNEVCFINKNNLYCLNPEEYEAGVNIALSAFDEGICETEHLDDDDPNGPFRLWCDDYDGSSGVNVYDGGGDIFWDYFGVDGWNFGNKEDKEYKCEVYSTNYYNEYYDRIGEDAGSGWCYYY